MRLLILFICCFLVFSVNAKESKKTTTVSPWLYKKSKTVEKLIAKKSYQQAQQKLESILSDIKKGEYEHAFVLKSLSSVHALKGRYSKAAELLAQSIDLKVMPEEEEQRAILNLGQLYMATEQYAKAIKTLEPWLKTHTNLDMQINVLVANAYTQLKHYRKALPYIKKAIRQSKKPKESWYQLNLALYYELEEYTPATDILKILISSYPDKQTYWQQLSSIYQQVKQYKKALSVKDLAYKKGFITAEKEILELANLFLFIGSPFKAAKLIEQEINQKRIKHISKNWEILANAWTMAKEFDHAIKALEIASDLNSKGSLYLQLGQLYVEQEKWSQAIKSLNNALNKGGLKNTGSAHLLLGMSYYELNDLEKANKSLLKATKYNKSKKAARQWAEYIKESG
jgi:tetratricopeptide (TPR) repeat protein